MSTKALQEGWHEICGIKFYGNRFPPDLIHDAMRAPGRFLHSSYCQVCMRRSDKCVCREHGLNDVKEEIHTIRCLSEFVPIEGCDYECTILGECKERQANGI